MAVRLSLKLGVVSERDRLPGSPDSVVVVEPTVGSIARTKGQLYLLVTSQVTGTRAREATRLAAQTIRDEYYYDESAGIRVCLEKVINLANKRLQHGRDRLGIEPEDGAGPIGVAAAIVRGSELYVVTVGPAEAYLIRGARLSTLPDPNREHGLPATDLELDVWRGELAVGDSLVLISPNVVARLGPDELKDSLVTLHPQSAMEHLHHRFVAAGGAGSDGAIALEATEVAATQRRRTLVPVHPAEPLAGAPDRSPIPLADTVTDGMAAVQAGARQARSAAGGWFGRAVGAVQDRLPRRMAGYRRVTPFATRQETQRRAAVALIAIVVVAGGLGFAVWLAGSSGPRESVASLTAGQRALEAARADIDQVWAPGVDLVKGDPNKARQLLEDAYHQLGDAETAGIPAGAISPLRDQVTGGLDRLFGVVEVRPTVVFAFPAEPAVELVSLIQGPDGLPYAIDSKSGTVLRIDAQASAAKVILRAGDTVAATKVGTPKLMAVGGPDLLVLDSNDVLWRWRPADAKGRGTVVKVKVRDSSSWGNDILAIGTFCRNADCSLYNLYVVDPSEKQVLTYSPAADGSGYPAAPTGRLATARDVSGFTDMYIDGDIFVADAGSVERYVGGRNEGWRTQDPDDTVLRPAPRYTLIASGAARRQGTLYAYDGPSARIVAFEKATGAYVEQYRLPVNDDGWKDVRGMFVSLGGDATAPATLYWLESDRLMSATLEAPVDSASPGPAGSPGASPSGSPGPSQQTPGKASPSPSAKP